MNTATLPPPDSSIFKWKPQQWLLFGAVLLAALLVFLPGLEFMVATWAQVEEYSYGYFIPFVSAFLVWQRSDELRQLQLSGSWSGLALVALAVLFGVVGDLSAIRLFSQYGFVIAVFGLSVCFIGWRGTRLIAIPLAILFFMIPLPQFLLRELSAQLQLVSSQIGVGLIRLFGISVFLEGNVIDLGSYKLQVAEACSGLRYLFPLAVLGFLAAYFFSGAMWKRLLIACSTVPLTILINSLRIGLIGVTVEHWGSAMAEGLLHDFEGWFMFMVCLALLVAEMALLARVGTRPQSLQAAFGLELPMPPARGAAVQYRALSRPLVVAGLALGVVSTLLLLTPPRESKPPARTLFDQFPLTLPGGWVGKPGHLERDVLAILALDDHFIADYFRSGEPPVNFYSAYYKSQSSGESTHSPRTCIPGGGWTIDDIRDTAVKVPNAQESIGTVLHVNRAVIQKGEHRQLVYYWFQQRGRVLTNEVAVKWFILKDAITRERTDGALVRLVTPLAPGESLEHGDARLVAFLATVQPRLPAFVPD